MGGQRDLHATGDTHYIPPPPTIYTTLAGYGIAERDGERRESGRRACLRIGTSVRYGAERDLCDTMRARRMCVLTDRDGVRATDRDDERHGAGPDGERTIGTAFEGGAATIGACERCGSEPRASVTERAVRALLDEFTARRLVYGTDRRRSPSRRRTTPTLNGGPLLDDLSYLSMGGCWICYCGSNIYEVIYEVTYMYMTRAINQNGFPAFLKPRTSGASYAARRRTGLILVLLPRERVARLSHRAPERRLTLITNSDQPWPARRWVARGGQRRRFSRTLLVLGYWM